MIRFYIKDTLIQISFLFVGIITLALLIDTTYTVILGVLSAFIHEVSHIVSFILLGKRPKKLSFEITGILLEKDNICMTIKQELIVLFSGSAVNLIIFVCIFSFKSNNQMLNIFAISNLILGVMNLLPLDTFDGGKIVNLILSTIANTNIAFKICKFIQTIITIIFFIVYFILVINYSFNFSLLIIAIYLFYISFNN